MTVIPVATAGLNAPPDTPPTAKAPVITVTPILGADVLFFLWRAPARQKVALLLLGPIAACVFLVAVPGTIWDRIRSFSSGPSIEAVESFESRRYLLDKSIEYTIKFPLFGVGPGQFASYEGGHSEIGRAHV